MKLQRIRIEQVRQFRRALELRDLDSGINLFSGPNEAGKSTVVAAIRAAFLERHRSNGVEDLRPWGDSAAAPEIDIDFTLDGRRYALSKRFLQRKRCTLSIGAADDVPGGGRTASIETLDGAAAEDRLAELLGFHYASRGASDAPQWGVPGLLWIQQGSGQVFRDAITYATDHLRGVLHDSLDALSSTGADAITAQVEAARNALLTPATGAPRGAFAEANAQYQTRAEQRDVLSRQILQYRQQVDELSALRRAHAEDSAVQPWRALRTQQRDAERALAEIDALTQTLQDAQRQWRQCDAQIALLRGQREAFDAQQTAFEARRVAEAAATQKRADADAALAQSAARREQAEAAMEQASRDGVLLQHRVRRAQWRRQLNDALALAEKASRQLADAEAAQARVRDRQAALAALTLDDKVLAALEKQHDALRDLRVRREVAATRVRFALHPGASLQLGDTTLQGDGERLLLEQMTIDIPTVGRLDIVPGGTDLAALGRDEAALRAEHDALLATHDLADLDAARQRRDAARIAQADLQAATASLDALAPKGVEALRDTYQTARDLAARLQTPPAGTTGSPDTDAPVEAAVDDAELERAAAAQGQARQQLDRATQQWHDARLQAAQAHAALDTAQRERERAQVALDAPDREARVAAIARQLTDTLAQAQTLQDSIARQEQAIAQARPDILRQDIARFARSAEQHEQQHDARGKALLKLEVSLEAAGAQGLDEQAADVARAFGEAARRRDDLQRRAAALDYLLTLLRDKQKALTQRLQAPLQRHLQHYLSLLFPGAALTLDAKMQPMTLVRERYDGTGPSRSDGDGDVGGGGRVERDERADVDALSFGAREQLGILTRLAYADLLREAGRPTLLMLDDALVHSDEARLAQMKRALFDAGTRHQILLFTCHPERWRDLGVTPRTLG
ncbi:AAA family ATPase [Robbsia sp. KACC 23696]|uniref:AAA family ATPase n=1 Tax=Robbsia sp. KACC 23696 TaxID=3149231 RepID=UPI00325B4778